MASVPETTVARATLVGHLGVAPGEPVTIEAWSPALDWARAFVVEARRLAAEPVLALEDEEGFFRSLARGGPVPTAPAALAGLGGAYVYLGGPEAFPRLFALGPEERALALERHGTAWRAAARASRLRGARLAVAGVTRTAAARFGINLETWRDEVVQASVVPPSRLASHAAFALRRLARARRMTIRHPNGTRLELELRPGRWVEEAGRPVRDLHRADAIWSNLPSGRIVLPVDAGSASGTWEANRPTYDRWGETPVGVGGRFAFKDGVLQEFAFDRGGEAFTALGPRAGRSPGVVGAVSLGLNPKISRAPEVGDLATGRLGLRFSVPRRPGSRASPRPYYVSELQGGEVELDGRLWLSDGRAVRTRGAGG